MLTQFVILQFITHPQFHMWSYAELIIRNFIFLCLSVWFVTLSTADLFISVFLALIVIAKLQRSHPNPNGGTRPNYRHMVHRKFLADRTNGRAYATVLRPSSSSSSFVCTECNVAKRCVLGQKLLLTAYGKSYMRNRLVPKWITLTFV